MPSQVCENGLCKTSNPRVVLLLLLRLEKHSAWHPWRKTTKFGPCFTPEVTLTRTKAFDPFSVFQNIVIANFASIFGSCKHIEATKRTPLCEFLRDDDVNFVQNQDRHQIYHRGRIARELSLRALHSVLPRQFRPNGRPDQDHAERHEKNDHDLCNNHEKKKE